MIKLLFVIVICNCTVAWLSFFKWERKKKPLWNECGRCVQLTTTPLPWQPPAKPVVMTSLPLKRVSLIFFSNLQKWSSDKINIFLIRKKCGKNYKWKKIQLQVSKSFGKKKSKSQLVEGIFFREKKVLCFFFKFTNMKFR